MTRIMSFTRLLLKVLGMVAIPAVLAFGQSGKIAGTITDAETGEALPGVNVIIEGTDQGAATDEDGHYFIINIDPGTYSVRASMIGYAEVTQTGVVVATDHTTPVDFSLETSAIAGEAVTIEAQREVVSMDRSASEITVQNQELNQTTGIKDVQEYIGLQAGVQGNEIRGGSVDQTQFMIDGLTVVDNRTNQPLMMVNLTAVKELSVIKGGFNAEYGNIRSGLINVVTKDGSPTEYNGSVDLRYAPSYQKHQGYSIFNKNNFYLRPYLDPGVAFVGTKNGDWSEEKQLQNLEFEGWNSVSDRLMNDDDPGNNMTPQQAQDRFIWMHAMEGSDSLGQRPRTYANKPDYLLDGSFGGPVPVIGSFLGNLTFFASYRNNHEMFGIPMNNDRPYFSNSNSQLKLTSRVTNNLKITLEGLYGELHTFADNPNRFYTSGNDYNLFNNGIRYLYWDNSNNPWDRYSSMLGLSIDHVLSDKTFYTFRLTSMTIHDIAEGPMSLRDTTTLRKFGNQRVDETPYGWIFQYSTMWDAMLIGGEGPGQFNHSNTQTLNAKFDITSQLNRYHQIKAGLLFNYDDVNSDYEWLIPAQPDNHWAVNWHKYPYRGGAYLQDKLEFEGMIANIGVRLDYNVPNTGWYTTDRYSKYFSRLYRTVFTDVAPTADTESHFKVSPRIGISHPISTNSKLYFNYGHFYSMPRSHDMFDIQYDTDGISRIGNPSLQIPRTVAYELGVESSFGQFLVHLSGYYKDITHQTGDVRYTNFSGTVNYATAESNNYEDIRGFEFRLERRFGAWLTGWVNYDYMVGTSGYLGRQHYFEDQRRQRIEGLQNPKQEKPLPRPVARAQFMLTTPQNFGGRFGNIHPLGNWRVGLLFQYRAGRYQTWDPLETYQLQDNIQWKDRFLIDGRLSKTMRLGDYNLQLYADIHNIFNLKYMETLGFEDGIDERNYLKSLHLPMYSGEEYQTAGLTAGNDKPGDVKSKDKPYIDMPNRGFLTYLNPRYVTFGFRFDF